MKGRILRSLALLFANFVILAILYSIDALSFLLLFTRLLHKNDWLILVVIPLVNTGFIFLLNLKFRFIDNASILVTQLTFFVLLSAFVYWLLQNMTIGL